MKFPEIYYNVVVNDMNGRDESVILTKDYDEVKKVYDEYIDVDYKRLESVEKIGNTWDNNNTLFSYFSEDKTN